METESMPAGRLRASSSAPILPDGLNSIDVVNALRIIKFAFRPLYAGELVEALAVDTENSNIDDIKRVRLGSGRLLLSLCQHLIYSKRLESRGQILVKGDGSDMEYYADALKTGDGGEAPNVKSSNGHALLTTMCIIYIRNLPDSRQSHRPLADYCAQYWARHARLCQDNEEVTEMVLGFINDAVAMDNWYQVYDIEDEELRSILVPRSYAWHTAWRSALYHAVFMGLDVVCGALLAQTDLHTDELEEALHAACFKGRADLVERLLTDGRITPDAGYGPFATPLAAAAAGGATDIVRLLLDRGARIPSDEDSEHPLMVAALYRRRGIVEEILARKPDWGNRQGVLDYCLQWLCCRLCNERINSTVALLLKYKANPLAYSDASENTALEIVLSRHHRSTMRIMIQAEYSRSALEDLKTNLKKYVDLAAKASDTTLTQSLKDKVN